MQVLSHQKTGSTGLYDLCDLYGCLADPDSTAAKSILIDWIWQLRFPVLRTLWLMLLATKRLAVRNAFQQPAK